MNMAANYFIIQRSLFIALIALLLAPFQAYADEPESSPIQEGDILPYLEQVITWRQNITDTELLADNAREVLLKDRLRQNSKIVLQKSFAFARAQATLFESAPATADTAPKEGDSRRSRLMKAAADAEQRVVELQASLKESALPQGKREKLLGELKLAKARQELLQTMIGIFSTEGDDSGTLLDQINALSRTVLNEAPEQAPLSKEEAAAKVASPKEKESASDNAGMFQLSGTLLSQSRKRDAIASLTEQTRRLAERDRALINSVRAALRAALAEGNALTAENDDNRSLVAYRKALDKLILRYKQISATIIPLGEMSMVLANADQSLNEWNRLTKENWSRVLHQLLIRLVVLTVSIAVPLIISGLARRATGRYVTDARRQRQVRIVRRILLAAVLTLVVLANFMTEFGSLATFAGFLTAGLAVALQTVLISLVAHFLFFGRYGVRSGDRITVSDVTGDVVQVGILRLYIRELKETEQGLAPTGKIVAFPNSILFQPTAFYKHMNNNN